MIRLTGAAKMRGLARQVARLKDNPMEPVAAPVAKSLEAEYRRSFTEQAGPTGGPWAPHKRPLGHPIGVETGRLSMPSVVVSSGAGGKVVRVVAPPRYAEFFNRRRPIVPRGATLGRWEVPAVEAAQAGVRELAARIPGAR